MCSLFDHSSSTDHVSNHLTFNHLTFNQLTFNQLTFNQLTFNQLTFNLQPWPKGHATRTAV
ncbi:hypothetical protein [Moorena sp. SIO2C4]|uniref:hypothetical protein n=1 Tax=Moorena sp. SIO2C4 TaxID=2607824 RepID=UPI0013CBDE1B|nr:hypothetical protein [Moorena sp. SIO2C4]NES40505.1 hypothetical protein [Moorena sp. SIO2C4]